jgi:hypothetical protein
LFFALLFCFELTKPHLPDCICTGVISMPPMVGTINLMTLLGTLASVDAAHQWARFIHAIQIIELDVYELTRSGRR